MLMVISVDCTFSVFKMFGKISNRYPCEDFGNNIKNLKTLILLIGNIRPLELKKKSRKTYKSSLEPHGSYF